MHAPRYFVKNIRRERVERFWSARTVTHVKRADYDTFAFEDPRTHVMTKCAYVRATLRRLGSAGAKITRVVTHILSARVTLDQILELRGELWIRSTNASLRPPSSHAMCRYIGCIINCAFVMCINGEGTVVSILLQFHKELRMFWQFWIINFENANISQNLILTWEYSYQILKIHN